MIVSYQHDFVFLKTRKVGGSSIEMYLRRYCGPDDVVTELLPEEEIVAESFGAREPSHVHMRPAYPWELTTKKIGRIAERREWPITRYWWTHQPAAEVRRKIGRDQWSKSFRFSVVRNPWERAVSTYFWANSRPGIRESMDEIVEKSNENWEIYTIRNKVAVDQIIRFENLLDDFRRVCDHIGIPPPLELPRLKTGIRPSHVDARTVLTKKHIDRIARLCRREIEAFGYEFDPQA